MAALGLDDDAAMSAAERTLRSARQVLLVDWPSREVPQALAEAGYAVVVKGGPEADAFTSWHLAGGEVRRRDLGGPLDHADLVYAYRPLDELPGIVQTALRLGASAVWRQSGLDSTGSRDPVGCWLPATESQQGRQLVESAGLGYIDDVYIVDAVRALAPDS
jgi:predicted CoA-binding protein